MFKAYIALLMAFLALGCGNESTDSTPTVATPDSSIHPTGVNEGAVISLDTAAYKVDDVDRDSTLLEMEKSKEDKDQH